MSGHIVLTSHPSRGAGAPAAAVAGTYPIVITPGSEVGTGLSNYTINFVNGTLTANQATVTITANNDSKTYGQTVTFAGSEFTSGALQNSDAIDSVSLASAGAAASPR